MATAHKKTIFPEVGPYVVGEAYQRILCWFFSFPKQEISLTDLCMRTGTSKSAANRIVLMLEKSGLLHKKVAGRAWLISAARSPKYLSRKIVANLALLFESDIVSLVRERVPNAKAIILFGSYRTGDDLPESDIDIAAEVAGDRPLEIVEFGGFSRFGYRRNVNVNLHVFSRKTIDINVFANIANGIVLDGFLEVRA